MNEENYTFNGGKVLEGQFTLDPLNFPFQGEQGISYRNITTAAEQGPSYILAQTTPASSFGRENNIAPGDWVVRDALSATNYRIVTDRAFQEGTTEEVNETVKQEERRAQDIVNLNRESGGESKEAKRARLQAELKALD